MKRIALVFLILVMGIAGFSQNITITKTGNFIKFTGLDRTNTQLPITSGVLYQSSVDVLGGYSGSIITFQRSVDLQPTIKIPFDSISNKLGQTTSAAYVAYLAANGYFANEVVINSASSSKVEGNVAHDAVDSGNPIKIGGKAVTSRPTAVANNDRVNAAYDELGRLHIMDDGAFVQANYYIGAGLDGIATFTTDTTITVSGTAYTIDGTNCYVSYIKYKGSAATAQWKTIKNGSLASIDASANVITVKGFPAGNKPFATGDSYVIGVRLPEKAYDATGDMNKVANLTPESMKFDVQTLVDSTNVGAAGSITVYYPSTTGLEMDGYKDFSLQFTTSGGITTTIEAAIDDAASPTWVDITKAGYELGTNATGATSFVDASGILDYSNLNVRLIRIKRVSSDATNAIKYNIRRKAQ